MRQHVPIKASEISLVTGKQRVNAQSNTCTITQLLGLQFTDFSSAFNTIQPHVMVQKLKDLNVRNDIIAWILEFLRHRRQYVKLNNSLSELVQINIGVGQGCVLSPSLYTIYTNDYRSHKNNTIFIKFADDSTIQGLLCDSEDCYFKEVKCFVGWCEKNFLMLNVKKTKEMVI